MKSNYLIYPMVLSDSDFVLLKNAASDLRNLNFERISSLRNCSHNFIYYLAMAILNLEEVITNSNSRGYRYNSYVLNMAYLKLSFAAELIEAKELRKLQVEFDTIKRSLSTIHEILESACKLQDVSLK
jgi:hypothetical protein